MNIYDTVGKAATSFVMGTAVGISSGSKMSHPDDMRALYGERYEAVRRGRSIATKTLMTSFPLFVAGTYEVVHKYTEAEEDPYLGLACGVSAALGEAVGYGLGRLMIRKKRVLREEEREMLEAYIQKTEGAIKRGENPNDTLAEFNDYMSRLSKRGRGVYFMIPIVHDIHERSERGLLYYKLDSLISSSSRDEPRLTSFMNVQTSDPLRMYMIDDDSLYHVRFGVEYIPNDPIEFMLEEQEWDGTIDGLIDSIGNFDSSVVISGGESISHPERITGAARLYNETVTKRLKKRAIEPEDISWN